MPHAFVTGGTGFLGGHLIHLLRAAGWQVTAMHRPQSRPDSVLAAGATPVAASLTDLPSLLNAMPEAVDAVFHSAANTAMWRRRNAEQTRDNVDGTGNMVAAALQRRARRFIHTSSISAWGIQSSRIDEQTPSRAEHDWINYNRSKYLAEQQVRQGIARGLDAVILNPCGIIGAGDRHNWAQLVMLINQGKLPGVPPGSGSFCDVREVAKAHLAAWQHGRCGSNYILAGVEASFLELARTIAHQLGRSGPRRPIPAWLLRIAGHLYPLAGLWSDQEPRLTPEKVALVTHRVTADGQRAITELGFNATVPLTEMVQECIDWMRAEGMLSDTSL